MNVFHEACGARTLPGGWSDRIARIACLFTLAGALLALERRAHAQAIDPRLELLTEAGAGDAPALPGRPPSSGQLAVVQPSAHVRIEQRGLRTTARYSPRLTWRRPNALDNNRPLLLHMFELATLARPSAPLVWGVNAGANVGEPDYSILPTIFGRSQTALPQLEKMLVTNAEAFVGYSLSPPLEVGLRLEGSHRRTLNEPAPALDPTGMMAPPLILPRQTSISGGPYVSRKLGPRDTVQLAGDLTYEMRQPDIRFLVTYVSASWQHYVARQQTLTLAVGFANTRIWYADTPALASDVTNSPIGSARYEALAYARSWLRLTTGAGVSVEHIVDPVLTRAGPRGASSAGIAAMFPVGWSVALDGGFATSLRGEPYATSGLPGSMPGAMTPGPDETTVSAALRVRYVLGQHAALEARGRWSNRGPHLEDPNFRFHQREIWVSMALVIASGNLAGR